MDIPERTLGKTGVKVSIIGLGGEGVLRSVGQENDSYQLINRAIDLGISYYDSARAYSGCEKYYGNALHERRKDIFLAGKSHARTEKEAAHHLHETLTNLHTDHLDLWQIHDVRTTDDVEEIFGPDGAINAIIDAKRSGRTRFIGVTGHHDPAIIRQCIELFDFDTVLIPVNPAEPRYKNFIKDVIPVANDKGMGIIGMKVYVRGFVAKLPDIMSMEPFFRYALSQQVSTAVIGCDTIAQLEENCKFANAFQTMHEDARLKLEGFVYPYAKGLMYYKG